MELLFAGLIALGVSVAIVFLLKCLCFLGECLSAQRKLMERTRPLNYSQAIAQSSVQQQSAVMVPIPSMGSASSSTAPEGPLSSIRRMSERLYFICMDANVIPKVVSNQKQIETDSTETDSPPTYEEAISLMNQPISHHYPPPSIDSNENRS